MKFKTPRMLLSPDATPSAPEATQDQNTSQVTTPEDVINNSSVEDVLNEFKVQLAEMQKTNEALKTELAEAKKTNLHLAMTQTMDRATPKVESFEDIIRQQSFYRDALRKER